jgi:signal transduction histidine kinase
MGTIVANLTLRAQLAVALGASALVTLLGTVTATLPAATLDPLMHVAVATAATVLSVLAAMLVYGRYARRRERSDLLLTAALTVFALANLCLSAAPALVSAVPQWPAAWAGVVAHGLGAALLTVAAFMPEHVERRPAAAGRAWLYGCGLAVALIAAAAALAGDALPSPLPSSPSSGLPFVGHSVIIGLETAILVLFASATLGFVRRAARGGDGLLTWLAIGTVFGTFARMNYVAYPSVLATWFAGGDVLWLAFSVCLLVGGAAELRRAQRAAKARAVDEERQRIARDLHDGAAQDLAYILQMARRLTKRDGMPPELAHVATAARHALDTTRQTVGKLALTSDEPLVSALRRAATEVAERDGARAVVEGEAGADVPATTRDELCLLVREAVANAIRHGGASTVRVRVQDAPELSLWIGDDGCGFDPEQVRRGEGHFGLAGMRQRVRRLGGELTVGSRRGRGTEIEVVLPQRITPQAPAVPAPPGRPARSPGPARTRA